MVDFDLAVERELAHRDACTQSVIGEHFQHVRREPSRLRVDAVIDGGGHTHAPRDVNGVLDYIALAIGYPARRHAPWQTAAVDARFRIERHKDCLLYTSDAADERSSVD